MNLFGIVASAATAAPKATQAPTEGEPGGLMALLAGPVPMMIIMIAIFYFLLIRPQRKRDKEKRAMLDALKVGDKVVTIGGICGKVSKIKDNYVFIETGNIGTDAEKSVLKMERSSIATVEQKIKN